MHLKIGTPVIMIFPTIFSSLARPSNTGWKCLKTHSKLRHSRLLTIVQNKAKHPEFQTVQDHGPPKVPFSSCTTGFKSLEHPKPRERHRGCFVTSLGIQSPSFKTWQSHAPGHPQSSRINPPTYITPPPILHLAPLPPSTWSIPKTRPPPQNPNRLPRWPPRHSRSSSSSRVLSSLSRPSLPSTRNPAMPTMFSTPYPALSSAAHSACSSPLSPQLG